MVCVCLYMYLIICLCYEEEEGLLCSVWRGRKENELRGEKGGRRKQEGMYNSMCSCLDSCDQSLRRHVKNLTMPSLSKMLLWKERRAMPVEEGEEEEREGNVSVASLLCLLPPEGRTLPMYMYTLPGRQRKGRRKEGEGGSHI